MPEVGESKFRLRKRAERELLKELNEFSLPAERKDISRLVHELQVHQIELELQKEELVQIQEKLEESNKRFRDLYDYAPVGYFSINSDYKITGVNLAGAQLLQEPRTKLLNMRFTRFIAAGETDRFHLYYRQVISSVAKLGLELEMQRTDKTAFYARLEGLKAGNSELRLALTDITGRKRAEESLKQSEERYREIVETTNEGILIVAPDGRILFANQRMADLLGYSLSEITGKAGLEFMDSDQRDLALRTRKELQRGNKLVREFKVRRKDGSILWMMASVTPTFDKNGHHIANLVMNTDITERKKGEEALKIRDMAIAYSKNAVALADLEGKLTYVNMAFLRLWGFDSEDEVLGRHAATFWQAPEEAEKIRRASLTTTWSGELVAKRRDGSTFPVEVLASAVPDENGNAIAQLGIFIDIFERKKAEEALIKAKQELETRVKDRTAELQQANTRLQQGEEKYRRIVETAGEGIITISPDGIMVLVNPRVPAMLGYPTQEMLGKPFSDFVYNNYRGKLKAGIENRNKGVVNSFEIKCLRKDGKTLWVKVNCTPFYDDKDRFNGSLCLFTDITEEKQLRDQLQDYIRRITMVQEEERKRIAYELHDDTAQYLSILKMQIGALAESGEIRSPKVKEKLRFLEKDADRAFNDVRRYSHELRPIVLEHQGLVAALEQIAEDYNKMENLSVEVQVEGLEPELSEEVKLGFYRIAQEALNNTRKHAKASQALIYLKFEDSRLDMSIGDNGIGFYLQDATSNSGSKGSLGLTSMKERAGLINADLEIESETGKGTKINLKARI